MVKSKVKSDLQQMLEAEGFEFLTNEDLYSNFIPELGYQPRFSPKTVFEIKAQYLSREGFSSVLVTSDAYDIKGKPLRDMAAIYVIRKN